VVYIKPEDIQIQQRLEADKVAYAEALAELEEKREAGEEVEDLEEFVEPSKIASEFYKIIDVAKNSDRFSPWRDMIPKIFTYAKTPEPEPKEENSDEEEEESEYEESEEEEVDDRN